MEIIKKVQGNATALALKGRLDTITCTQLANELGPIFDEGPVNLVFDFAQLQYISSAGLRVLLMAQKRINALGTEMEIIGASETVREVFDITGFSAIIKIV